MNNNSVFIIGVGMTKFFKPGSHSFSYIDLGKEEVIKALDDANIDYKSVNQAYVGYVFQSSCAGQRVLYEVGMTGIPIVNVNNNCATGSTAFNLAYQSVKSGISECALALGFDVMQKGPLPLDVTDPIAPTHKYAKDLIDEGKYNFKGPSAPQLFGHAGREHMDRYGTTLDQISKISVKNYQHGSNNPYAQFQQPISLEKVKEAPIICSPLTKFHCCPTSDGAACAIVCNKEFMIKHGLQNQAIEILASVLETDKFDTFSSKSRIDVVGYKTAQRASKKALSLAGLDISDIGAIELHDCFAANELLTYEALGLCTEGKAGEFIDNGDNTYGGKYIVNPSGGLTSKGHPLGATGIAQLTELSWQLRGMADKRQIKNLKYALSHNLGLGTAIVITILKKHNKIFDGKKTSSHPDKIKIEQAIRRPKF
jgi:acetyl-CoA acetyltransferase